MVHMPVGYSSVKKTYMLFKEHSSETITPAFVARELNISNSLAYQCLYQLKGRGIVQKNERGLYLLTDAGKARNQYDEKPVVKTFKAFKYPIEIWPIHKYLGYVQKACFDRAKYKNLTYELPDGYLEIIWERQEGRCFLSGVPMTTVRGQGWQVPTNASCDRIDTSVGYIEMNVRLVCWQANQMRGQLTDEELVVFCKLIFEKSNGKNGHRAERK